MSSSITPALMRHWAVHAGLIYAYSFFRVAYADAPSMAKSPSYLISLGIVPHDATQEVDLFAVTLVLSAQKWRRSTNNFEFAETLIWYLQLAVGALLALTDARPCIAYAALVIGAAPVPRRGCSVDRRLRLEHGTASEYPILDASSSRHVCSRLDAVPGPASSARAARV